VRLYHRFDLHPGLLVIVPVITIGEQHRVFGQFCDRLPALDDLVNKLVDLHADGHIEVTDWPPFAANDPNP
jgi:hypothetical protein